ncbi:MAG: HD domain-containing phosphohydrolase [archaeon]
MDKKSLTYIMNYKFKKLRNIIVVTFFIVIIFGGFLLYNNFYKRSQEDVFKDINFYLNNLDVNNVSQNSIIEDLNYILSNKKVKIQLNNESENKNNIYLNSLNENKLVVKKGGFFEKSYYKAVKLSEKEILYVKINVIFSFYRIIFFILLIMFFSLLSIQVFLRENFKKEIKNVVEAIQTLSEKMNNYKLKDDVKFNSKDIDIKEIDDIQENFIEMIEEVNASYEQLEAYNNEIIEQNKKLNIINNKYSRNRKKYKRLFNNMLNAFAYYKVIYNNNMKAVDYELVECNRAFENIFNINLEKENLKLGDFFEDGKKKLIKKHNEVINGRKNSIEFEQYYSKEDRWFYINAFSTDKGRFATIISDITNLKKSKKEQEKLSNNLEKVISLTSILTEKNLSENEFLHKLLNTAVEVIPEASYGTVYKNKEDKIEFVYAIGHNIDILKQLSLDQELFYNKRDQIEIIENTMDNNKRKFDEKQLEILKKGQKNIKETMTFDLIIDGDIKAGLNIDIKANSENSFSENSQRLFNSFRNISTSFYRLKKFGVLQDEFTKELILSIVRMLEIHDLYTRGHSESVAKFSKKIAEKLGLSKEKINESYWTGMVHDIGKILIPDHILNKEGKLSDDEYEVIKKHPVWGYQTLNTSEDLQNIARYVLFHHERWDGKGYPRGLKKDETPLISRIIAVADTWDAMRSDRSYRDALSKEKAKKELIINKGTQFEPKIVDIFLKIIK